MHSFLTLLPRLTHHSPPSAASIPGWWIWLYWTNPVAYAIRALLVNEMNTDDWSTPVVIGTNQVSLVAS